MYLLTKNQNFKEQPTEFKESIHKPNSVLCDHLSSADNAALQPTHRSKETDSFPQLLSPDCLVLLRVGLADHSLRSECQ